MAARAFGCLVVCAGLLAVASQVAAQSAPQTYKGLEVSVTGLTRATNVSLTDCPPGANTVRGVIKPGDTTEFASVTLAFTATPAFKPGPMAKPMLHDASGKTYNTAQAFAEVAPGSSFSCTFAFRVPKGTAVTRFRLDTLSIDVSKMGQ
ncbi:MAG: hypothetical protein ACT4QD_26815 [Acidobacteriota bacterium]